MTIVIGGAADADLVARTVASALAQTEAAIEVLLLGASSVPYGVAADARVRTAVAQGSTQGALLQAGLERARAPYVLIARPGDLLQPSFVARHLAAMETYPPAAITLCRGEAAGAANECTASPTLLEARGRGAMLARLLSGGALPSACLLLRRAAVLVAGGFEPAFTARADDDLWLRLLPRATVRVVDETLVALGPEERDQRGAIALAEQGRALVRAFASCTVAEIAAALGDGSWRAPGEDRLELAGLLAQSPIAEAAALAQRVALEALQLGATLPAAPAFEILRARAPELGRVAVPAELQQGGRPLYANVRAALLQPADAPPPSQFPPRLRLALWAPSIARLGAAPLLEHASALAAAGIDLLVLARGEDEVPDPWTRGGGRVELLQWTESTDELATLLAQVEVGALLVDAQDTAARTARQAGVAVLARVPRADNDADLAAATLRAIAVAAADQADAASAHAIAAWQALFAERAAMAALRVASGGMRDSGSITGNRAPRFLWSDDQRHDLIEIAREAHTLTTMAASMRSRAQQVLDKLRLGHRIESGVRELRRRLQSVTAPRVITLDSVPADDFLARATATSAGWLWVVYATDPYSETRGQRSMWLAQELARRGHHVVYLYWRWQPSEPIPPSGEPNVLVVPIDQLSGLQARLLRLRAPGHRVLLIEFPDVALYERLNVFNAHGWTTVYDCVDEWEEFGRIGQAAWYDRDVERHLARDADVVVATHPLLAEKLGAMAERTVPLVPNGVKLDDLRAPDSPRASQPSAPVIGYFGHLTSSWFDWDLLRSSAARNPQWRFEIFGYGQPEHLELPSNVVVPGMLPHAELSRRTTHWSAALVPFREGRLTQAVDPVKLYEYLALGLPVVAVGMPHLRGVPGVVVCDRQDFDAAIRTALATPLDRERVAAFVADSRWERRVDALLALVEGADPARNVVKALAG